MIDDIQIIKVLLHLWNNVESVFEYKHTIPDLSQEIKDLYNFSDVKIYGDIIKFGNYNYVFTTEDANYETILRPMMKIIDNQKTYVETIKNNELQKDQFVVHMYVDITKSYDTISNFVYNATDTLPIFNENTFYTPAKIERESNKFEFVRLSAVQDVSSLLDADRYIEFNGAYYVVRQTILSGNSLWNMIYDVKRTNKSSVYIQFKPYAVEMLQKYCYQHHNESFAILLNDKLFSIPMKPLESHVLDNNAWQIAYDISSQDVKIEDEKKPDSLLNVFKRAKLGYAQVELISENQVNFTDTIIHLFICVVTLLLLLLFFLFVKRRDRRRVAMATLLSSVYVGAMFDGPIRVLYLFLILIDSLFYLIKDSFSSYIFKITLYVMFLMVSFFLSVSMEILIQNMLMPLFMSIAVSFAVQNTLLGKFFDKELEDKAQDNNF